LDGVSLAERWQSRFWLIFLKQTNIENDLIEKCTKFVIKSSITTCISEGLIEKQVAHDISIGLLPLLQALHCQTGLSLLHALHVEAEKLLMRVQPAQDQLATPGAGGTKTTVLADQRPPN